MRKLILLTIVLLIGFVSFAQTVTVVAVAKPAATVFRSIAEQTGMNFVYSADLLEEVTVTVNVKDKPLKQALDLMFRNTDIEYKIKGKNIILKHKPDEVQKVKKEQPVVGKLSMTDSLSMSKLLAEVTVVSRLESPVIETPEIGAKKMTANEIINTPVLFGESDVIKTLLIQPGISEGQEGLSGMNVHGGNADENLYMLDNVLLYQVNHFGGLFSAFNVEAIRYIDFFKSSIPAKYDGRLSSYLDVRTKNGSHDGHHGSGRLGLTSGAFNISGSIGRKTTYMVALRRSWFDVLTIPTLAIINAANDEWTNRFNYAFMDLNGKVTHRFSNRATGFVSVYYGNDLLKTGSADKENQIQYGWIDNLKYDFNWGNLVAQVGCNYRFNSDLTAEFTAAYTRYFSSMKYDCLTKIVERDSTQKIHEINKTNNNINDWIFRGDFDWSLNDDNRIRFGGNYILHSFLPSRSDRNYTIGSTSFISRDLTWRYLANEANIYAEDDWHLSDRFMMNVGLHLSLFNIDGKTDFGFAPRLSVSYRPVENWAVKAAYARTNQYVHQLSQTYLSLPSDQWVPVTRGFKPETADKVSVGAYWSSDDRVFGASVEGYYKTMRNLVDYRDEYYLQSPIEMWNAQLCSGNGTAKGIDFKVEKVFGKLTGHIAYSLAWSDRIFPDKNGGHPFPARFDNRHTIKVLLNWNVSKKVSLNAAWVGHSGNRFTLLPQVWEMPDFDNGYDDEASLKTPINNYQLPFYHRLDLSCMLKNHRGYWTFGLFNAYCHMNTVAIRRTYDRNNNPKFQKVKLFPIIPSISYTWQF
ncbi:MAG: TonB-dependent receptor [Muribaculaceae bacterium]|nr:TonB-dependent receptor [Muribaculaceae bacterium]